MGLLKRFRASSSASTQPPANDFDDLPPPPLPHAYSQSQLFASVSRASVAESTTATTPKSSKFWKRKDKSKGKEKEVAGIPYESTPPAPSPSSRSASHSFHHVPSPSARSVGSGYNERPLYAQTQSTPTPHYHYQQQRDNVPAARGMRDGSATPTTSPRQETTPKAKGILKPRAMLGRMDFESSSPNAQPIGESGLASLMPDADFASMVGERHSSYLPQQMAPRQSQPYGRPQTMILADERTNRSSQEEVMEHLVSPEKRETWTPKSGVEARDDEVEDPGSPTPRKSALPPQQLVAPASKTTADDHHAPSTRRPSASRRSSFIPMGNPFARRASVVSDLDAQVIDDGSFQITGFRHVSGASEADHGLDPYHRQQARAEIKDHSDSALPPSRPASTAPAAAAIQRPVSRATSLASIDDHITSTAKVSAAAFRKGIRRASSNYLEADDDEDDVPLGLLRPGGRSSSALSLSSMREGGSARMAKSPVTGPMRLGSSTNLSQSQPVSPHRIRKSPSLGPAVGIESQAKVQMHTRTKTMPLISPDEIHPIFSSPSNSPVPSPKRATAPLPNAGSSDYFALKAQPGVQAGDGPRTPPVVVEANITASPGFDFDSLDYPVSAFSTSPEVSKVVKALPKVAPVTTKTSGLAVTIPSPSAGNASAGTSAGPGSAPKKEDREDTLDEDLVLRSMALYGDNTAMNEVDIGIENEPPARRIAVRQQSQSALSPVESESNVRSPLSERLGNLVIHGPRPMTSKPSLPKLNTLKLDDGPTKEKVMSPASDSTVSPIAREQQTPTLSSSFARVNGPRGNTVRRADLSDSEGTDSSDEESDVRPTINVPPRSSFANAPRPVSNHLSTSSQSSLSRPVNFGSDDESDDEPLARIKSKASRSSLAVDRTSNHTPGTRPATIHSSSPNAKPSSRTAAVSTSPPLPPSAYARRSSVPTASIVPTPPTTAHMQGKVWDASPASSQSGLTGDSTNQPITPSDHEIGNGRGFRDGPAAMWSDNSFSKNGIPVSARERRGSHHSAATAATGHGHFDASHAPPMPVDVGDPLARQRMKEVWQAQYMAAASRAFEDEWERQSNASVASPSVAPSVAHSTYSPATQAMPHPYHQHPYTMPPPMPMMPMGYGYPPVPAQGYMYPQHPQQYPHPQQMHEPSMYSYGPGAQSVYGAEFGPPTAQMPYSPHRPMSMVFPQSYSTSNLSQYASPPPAQRPALQSSQSSYFTQSQQSPGPGQGHERGGSGDMAPPKGLINQIPSSPSRPGGSGHHHRRSQLGTSVITANDRPAQAGALPPTSWRRSTAPLSKPSTEESVDAPRRKRQSSYLVN